MLKRRREREERRKKIVMGTVISALMVFSIFGIVVGGFNQGGGTRAKYNDFKFERVSDGYYITEINNQDYSFWFFPADLESIPYQAGTAEIMKQAKIIPVSVPPNISLNNAQVIDTIKYDLTSINNLPIASASTGNNSFGWPIANCEDATLDTPVVKVIISSEPSITLNGNCIVIEGNNTGFLQVHDRLIYTLAGVMKDE